MRLYKLIEYDNKHFKERQWMTIPKQSKKKNDTKAFSYMCWCADFSLIYICRIVKEFAKHSSSKTYSKMSVPCRCQSEQVTKLPRKLVLSQQCYTILAQLTAELNWQYDTKCPTVTNHCMAILFQWQRSNFVERGRILNVNKANFIKSAVI